MSDIQGNQGYQEQAMHEVTIPTIFAAYIITNDMTAWNFNCIHLSRKPESNLIHAGFVLAYGCELQLQSLELNQRAHDIWNKICPLVCLSYSFLAELSP